MVLADGIVIVCQLWTFHTTNSILSGLSEHQKGYEQMRKDMIKMLGGEDIETLNGLDD